MRPIIQVEGVGKQYRLGEQESAYGNLRESIVDALRSPFKKLRSKREASDARMLWALKDVSFEIAPGEIVGIIGRNGAGKSTLLKVLSRITEPTLGQIKLYGRVASLLEVGTGFHPELTGRENIFLNGSLLGMSRKEIEHKFDEIVAFAEVGKFIDTPVKRYSSGMYVRLAFAVAAYLEPEILLVDEVLAVGDASFQRKCLDKMKDVGQHGRTVLFISHNMSAITRLCPRTILLDEGRVLQDGPSHQVVGTYLKSGLGTTAAREWPELDKAPGNEIVRLRSVRVRTDDGQTTEAIDIRRPVNLEIEYDVLKPGFLLAPIFHVFNEEGIFVFVTFDSEPEWKKKTRPVGRFVSVAQIPGNFLSEGSYIIAAAISTLDPVTVHFYERDVVAFQMIDTLDGDSARREYAGFMPGVIRPLLHWETRADLQANKELSTEEVGTPL